MHADRLTGTRRTWQGPRFTLVRFAAAVSLLPLLAAGAVAQNANVPSPLATTAKGEAAQRVLMDGLAAAWRSKADGAAYRELQAAAQSGLVAPQQSRLGVEDAVALEAVVTRLPEFVQEMKERAATLQALGDRVPAEEAPFLARAGVALQQRAMTEAAANSLLRIDRTGRDLQTGLLLREPPVTTTQQTAIESVPADDAPWSRDAVYALHLTETLDAIPLGLPQRGDLIEALNKTVFAISTRVAQLGGWKNDVKSQAASRALFAYAVYHGVRLGWLAGSDRDLADQAFAGLPDGADHTSSPMLAGALLLVQAEHLDRESAFVGKGVTITMDAWFNAATRPSLGGGPELFLYKWTDETDTGFSFVGQAFRSFGVETTQLTSAPTQQNLATSQVYFIVSPPLPSTNLGSHAMDKGSSDAVEAWVRGGGVLVLMLNDPAHTDFSLNLLAERFHLRFNPVDLHIVDGPPWSAGALPVPAGTGIFQQGQTAFLSGSSSLSVQKPAVTAMSDGSGPPLVAVTTYGRGTVLAIANPWFVNRTTDGRLLPPEFDNYKLAKELASWLIEQTEQ